MQYQIATFKRKSPFVNSLREKMRLMHLSPRTEEAYVHWVIGRDSGTLPRPAFAVEWLTHDEVRRAMESLDGDYRMIARLAYGTGLNLMELLGLRYRDFSEFSVSVGGRSVPIPNQLAPCFLGRPVDDYVFKSPQNSDRHLLPTGVQTAFKRAGVRVGIKKRVNPKIFRDSFAVHFLELGGGLVRLQQILGHKELSTTMRYAHCVDVRKVRLPLDHLPCECC